ncbi:metallophosphoesterase [Micromonospora zhanjiangensis]
MTAGDAVQARPARRSLRPIASLLTLVAILALLFGVPWWTLTTGRAQWPAPLAAAGSAVFAVTLVAFPVLMYLGHGRRQRDWAARTGDTILGLVWILFVWALLGNVARLALAAVGVADPARSRLVAVGTLAVSAVLALWGYVEAMRVPRVRRVDVTLDRLAPGLDGLRVVLITDTHYGPIDRAGWSARTIAKVNELDADVVCHTGDIADGSVARRRAQAAPLGEVRARLARTYVTGNHEYLGEAQGWLDHMRDLGWEPLHNRHIVVRRDGAGLVVAGVDDRTAASSGSAGLRADHAADHPGADPELLVVLLAHQPKQLDDAVGYGVDLQLSGHTHGGQVVPFNYVVRLDQPVVQGLRRHGRTQLYTSRGTGFWGPPFRIFAPSEITLLTLRAG